MKFGVREICDVVLKKKAAGYFGKLYLDKDMPVMYFDTLKTSSLEGASTTVYAQGGKGNPRLVAWEGDRTVTFTMEDALISPESFSILSGAGFMDADNDNPIYVHTTEEVQVKNNELTLSHVPATVGGLFIMLKNEDGSINTNRVPMEIPLGTTGVIDGRVISLDNAFTAWAAKYNNEHAKLINAGKIMEAVKPVGVDNTDDLAAYNSATTPADFATGGVADYVDGTNPDYPGSVMYVDYYVKSTQYVKQIDIEAGKFGGSYYLEASTLFRDQATGEDYPAEFVIPNCKVQSNFTFTMSPTGDPSTFTFTMDAFPDYTKFNKTKKVIAAIQIVEDKDLYDGGASDESEDAKVANEYHENSGKTPPGRFATANGGNEG
jgi:hypothetical protein